MNCMAAASVSFVHGLPTCTAVIIWYRWLGRKSTLGFAAAGIQTAGCKASDYSASVMTQRCPARMGTARVWQSVRCELLFIAVAVKHKLIKDVSLSFMAVWRTHGPASSRRASSANSASNTITHISSIRSCFDASGRCQQPLLQACKSQFSPPTSTACSFLSSNNHLVSQSILVAFRSSHGKSQACSPCQASLGQNSSSSRPVSRSSTLHVRPLGINSCVLASSPQGTDPQRFRFHLSSYVSSSSSFQARHSIHCYSTSRETTGSGVSSSSDVVTAAPLDWSVEVGGWRVRTFTPEDLPQVRSQSTRTTHRCGHWNIVLHAQHKILTHQIVY